MKYEDLQVWQKSILLVKAIYQESKNFPADERFGLISQIAKKRIEDCGVRIEGMKSLRCLVGNFERIERTCIYIFSVKIICRESVSFPQAFLHNPHSSILFLRGFLLSILNPHSSILFLRGFLLSILNPQSSILFDVTFFHQPSICLPCTSPS